MWRTKGVFKNVLESGKLRLRETRSLWLLRRFEWDEMCVNKCEDRAGQLTAENTHVGRTTRSRQQEELSSNTLAANSIQHFHPTRSHEEVQWSHCMKMREVTQRPATVQHSWATPSEQLARARHIHIPAALNLQKKSRVRTKQSQMSKSGKAAGWVSKCRGVHTGNEEPRRGFPRWLHRQLQASFKETTDHRAKSLGNWLPSQCFWSRVGRCEGVTSVRREGSYLCGARVLNGTASILHVPFLSPSWS